MKTFIPLFVLLVGLVLALVYGLPADPEVVEQDVLTRAVAAHGGLEQWQSYASLTYDISRAESVEHHTIDLHSRNVRQEAEEYVLGFDGEEVWVAPGLDAYSGNARFNTGLYFYFFAMPFVFTDPGVHTRYVGQRTVDGQPYEVVEVTYGEQVGESPDDMYLAHFDPQTYQLQFVCYTVTYFSQAPTDNFNAIVFPEWEEVGGLRVPVRMVFYHWDEEQQTFGDQRAERHVEAISFAMVPPDANLFIQPADGVVVPLPEDAP